MYYEFLAYVLSLCIMNHLHMFSACVSLVDRSLSIRPNSASISVGKKSIKRVEENEGGAYLLELINLSSVSTG